MTNQRRSTTRFYHSFQSSHPRLLAFRACDFDLVTTVTSIQVREGGELSGVGWFIKPDVLLIEPVLDHSSFHDHAAG